MNTSEYFFFVRIDDIRNRSTYFYTSLCAHGTIKRVRPSGISDMDSETVHSTRLIFVLNPCLKSPREADLILTYYVVQYSWILRYLLHA